MPMVTMAFVGIVMASLISMYTEYPSLQIGLISSAFSLQNTNLPVYSDGYVTVTVCCPLFKLHVMLNC